MQRLAAGCSTPEEIIDRSTHLHLSYDDMMDHIQETWNAEGEQYAEGAWLRQAENRGWMETSFEERIDAERGVIPFHVELMASKSHM